VNGRAFLDLFPAVCSIDCAVCRAVKAEVVLQAAVDAGLLEAYTQAEVLQLAGFPPEHVFVGRIIVMEIGTRLRFQG